MRWIKWDDSRISLLPQVLSKVRLPLLTPQFLADRVATEDLIRTSHQCRDLLDEAKDFHLMPERRGLVQSFRTRPRHFNDTSMGQIFAVGGLTKNGDSVSTVEIYDPLTKVSLFAWIAFSGLHFIYIYVQQTYLFCEKYYLFFIYICFIQRNGKWAKPCQCCDQELE